MKISWKKMLLLPAAAALLSSALLLTGCPGETPDTPALSISKVSITTAEEVKISSDIDFAVTAEIDGKEADITKDAVITFKDGDNFVETSDFVEIDKENKKLKGLKEGEVTLKASYKGKDSEEKVIKVVKASEEESKVLSGLNITGELQIQAGKESELKAEAVYSDNTTADVTEKAVFKSGNESVATVERNKIKGAAKGNTEITVTYTEGEVTKEEKVTIVVFNEGETPEKVLSSITVTADKAKIEEGNTTALKVTANYSDGATADVTEKAVFKSSDENVAKVEKNIVKGVKKGTVKVTVTYTVAEATKTSDISIEVTEKPAAPKKIPSSLKITAEKTDLTKDSVQPLTVTVSYEDGTSKDVTSSVTLASSASDTVKVEGKSIKAVKAGKAEITASYTENDKTVTGKLVITVVDSASDISIYVKKAVPYKDAAPKIWVWQAGKLGENLTGSTIDKVKMYSVPEGAKLKSPNSWWMYTIKGEKYDPSKPLIFKLNDTTNPNTRTYTTPENAKTFWFEEVGEKYSYTDYSPVENDVVESLKIIVPSSIPMGKTESVIVKAVFKSKTESDVTAMAIISSPDKEIIVKEKTITGVNGCTAKIQAKYTTSAGKTFNSEVPVTIEGQAQDVTIYISKRSITSAGRHIYVWQEGTDLFTNKISGDWDHWAELKEADDLWWKFEIKAGNYVPGKTFSFKATDIQANKDDIGIRSRKTSTFYYDKEKGIRDTKPDLSAQEVLKEILITLADEISSGREAEIKLEADYTTGKAPITKDFTITSDSEFTAVYKDGKIQALCAGKAKITAQFGGKTAVKTITVKDGPANDAYIYVKKSGDYKDAAPKIWVWQIDGTKGVSEKQGHTNSNPPAMIQAVGLKSPAEWWQYKIAKADYVSGKAFKFKLNDKGNVLSKENIIGTVFYDSKKNEYSSTEPAAEPKIQISIKAFSGSAEKNTVEVGKALTFKVFKTVGNGTPEDITQGSTLKIAEETKYLGKIEGSTLTALADGKLKVTASWTHEGETYNAEKEINVTAPEGGNAKTIYVFKVSTQAPQIWVWQNGFTEVSNAKGETNPGVKMTSHNDYWWKYEIPNGKYIPGKPFTFNLFYKEGDGGNKSDLLGKANSFYYYWDGSDKIVETEPDLFVQLEFEGEFSVKSGEKVNFKVNKVTTKGVKTDVTSSTTFTSSNEKAGKIEDKALAGILEGKTTVKAEFGGKAAEQEFTVTKNDGAKDPVVIHIANKSGNTQAPKIWVWQKNGAECSKVMGKTDKDSLTKEDASWWKYEIPAHKYTFGKEFCFEINEGGYNNLKKEDTGKTASFWFDGTNCHDTKPAIKTPQSLEITNMPLTLEAGAEIELKAQVTYTDGTKKDVTEHTTFTLASDEESGLCGKITNKKLKGISIGKSGNGKVSVTASYTEGTNPAVTSAAKEFTVTAPASGSNAVIYVRKYGKYNGTEAPNIWVWQEGAAECSKLMGAGDYENLKMAADGDFWWKYEITNGKYTPNEAFTVKLNKDDAQKKTVDAGKTTAYIIDGYDKILEAKPVLDSIKIDFTENGVSITKLQSGKTAKVVVKAKYAAPANDLEIVVTEKATISEASGSIGITVDATKKEITGTAAGTGKVSASYTEGEAKNTDATITVEGLPAGHSMFTVKSTKNIGEANATVFAWVWKNSDPGKWVQGLILSNGTDLTFVAPSDITGFKLRRKSPDAAITDSANWNGLSGNDWGKPIGDSATSVISGTTEYTVTWE